MAISRLVPLVHSLLVWCVTARGMDALAFWRKAVQPAPKPAAANTATRCALPNLLEPIVFTYILPLLTIGDYGQLACVCADYTRRYGRGDVNAMRRIWYFALFTKYSRYTIQYTGDLPLPTNADARTKLLDAGYNRYYITGEVQRARTKAIIEHKTTKTHDRAPNAYVSAELASTVAAHAIAYDWRDVYRRVYLSETARVYGANPEFDYLFKILMIGSSRVGKTCYMHIATDSEPPSYISTIGVDFRFRRCQINDQTVKLQIWDTAGQERFRTITSSYYRGAQGIVMCYDISNYESFTELKDWYLEVQRYGRDDVAVIVVGCKSDLATTPYRGPLPVDYGAYRTFPSAPEPSADAKAAASAAASGLTYRQVSYVQGVDYAKSINAQFFESSAKNHTGIYESIDALTRQLLDAAPKRRPRKPEMKPAPEPSSSCAVM